jgi:TonB family protein
MFEFAISRNQRRRPTKRIIASAIFSCLAHVLFFFLVIRYPQLLEGGKYHHFRPLSALANLLGSSDKTADEDKDWRTVAILGGPMMQPSAETLKKYLHNWDQKGSGPPPVRIRWGNEEKALENAPPMAKLRQEPKPIAPVAMPPPNEGITGSATGTANAQPSGGNSADAASGSSGSIQGDSNSGKKGTVNLPPPVTTPKPDIASNNPPNSIPNGVKPPTNNSSQSSVKEFENEQKAIQSPGSGIFGTGGFDMGNYRDILANCIKGKWEIPSNLRNSQGHTTIVFYVAKDGRISGIRIVEYSGNKSLDLAALKAVVDASPAPALPKGYPGEHVGAKFVLSYNEP